MSDTDKPKLDGLAMEQALWDRHRQRLQANGINFDQFLTEWTAEQEQKLESPGARTDFAELCRDGCAPQVLAAVIALLRFSPRLERFWTETVGRPDDRQKAARTLENAAATLEKLFGEFIAAEDESQRIALTNIGRLPFSRLIPELRFYVRLLNFAEGLRADTETRSVAELSKFLLTSYVERSTGRSHDRNVSALIGEVVGAADYNEVAQRMWRLRNYKRLEKYYSKLTDFLVNMSAVIAHRT